MLSSFARDQREGPGAGDRGGQAGDDLREVPAVGRVAHAAAFGDGAGVVDFEGADDVAGRDDRDHVDAGTGVDVLRDAAVEDRCGVAGFAAVGVVDLNNRTALTAKRAWRNAGDAGREAREYR